MDIAALAMGCNLIEKTSTKARMTRSVEHVMSIEQPQFKPFIQAIPFGLAFRLIREQGKAADPVGIRDFLEFYFGTDNAVQVVDFPG